MTSNTLTRTTLVTALAAAGVVIAACGSDDRTPLSRAEFIDQANAICRASNDEAEPIFDEIWIGIGEGDPAADVEVFDRWADAMKELGPIFHQQLDDIRELAAPTGDQQFIATLLDDQDAAITEFVRIADAAAAGDENAREVMGSDDDLFADIDRRAREYGLTVCGGSEE